MLVRNAGPILYTTLLCLGRLGVPCANTPPGIGPAVYPQYTSSTQEFELMTSRTASVHAMPSAASVHEYYVIPLYQL